MTSTRRFDADAGHPEGSDLRGQVAVLELPEGGPIRER